MAGIISYGVKIPKRRLKSEDIRAVWKNTAEDILESMGFSERCVTGPDEDAITLGVESAKNCLSMAGISAEELDGIIFASGTNPYATRASAVVIQDVLGARSGMFVSDIQFAARSGMDGIYMASNFVDSGKFKYVLVVASDCLNQYISPGHVYEYGGSAGAASFLIGRDNTIADIEDMAFSSEDRADWFRLSGDRYMQLGGGFVGYVSNWGLTDSIKPAWDSLLSNTGLKPEDFTYAAVPQGTCLQPVMAVKATGLPIDAVLPYVLTGYIADAGCAGVLLSLCHILDYAEPMERAAAVAYGWGSGAAAASFVVKDRINDMEARPYVISQLENKIMVDYASALKYEKKLDRNLKGLSSYY